MGVGIGTHVEACEQHRVVAGEHGEAITEREAVESGRG